MAWASYEAAKYACEHWHYSGRMPSGKLVRIGVWEAGSYIGCVVFGRGANRAIASRFGLEQTECCELTRIALTKHTSPVSRIGAIAVRMLRSQSPGLRLLVSYADPEMGHHGGIYQAMNWLYVGRSHAQSDVVVNGQRMHKRTASARFGTASVRKLGAGGLNVTRTEALWKHTFILPIDPLLKESLGHLSSPYPKRAKQAMAGPLAQRQCDTDLRAPQPLG